MVQRAASGLAMASPAMNQAMGHGAALGLAFLSSFGAGSGMLGLPFMRRGEFSPPTSQSRDMVHPMTAVCLQWSSGWGVVTAAVVVVFLVWIGAGLH